MASSLIQPFMLPAFAAAGDNISNTATATYKDSDGKDFDTQSNTVVVKVAEIAGITVTPAGVVDRNLGSFEANDILDFRFTVTNVGNDTTDVQLPGLDDILKQNLLLTGTNAQVEVFSSAGASLGSYTGNAPVRLSTLTPGLAALPAGASVTVVVTGTVPASGLNPGDDISVTLGNTPPNDNTAATQNQPVDAGNVESNVRTVDLPDGTPGEAAGVLTIAREKEASASQTVDFATQQKPLALATVKKTDSNVDPGATGAANDDVITYDLTLTVERNTPNAAFVPTALAKTPILLNSATVTTDVVLVSDAIPEFTQYSGTVSAPSGWQVVYSVSNPTNTSPVVAPGGTAAQWTTAAPANATVKRIGFIYTGATALPANGNAITGFRFNVVTSGLPAAGGSVYNLAQAFGKTYDDPANPNNPVDQIIYDESGDVNPNNFENSTPPTETNGGTPDGSDFDPTNDTGKANPTVHGTDDGSNTGVGPDGEDNQVVLTGESQVGNDNILNGPNGSPSAVGPTDDDDDYTNKAIDRDQLPAGTVVFTNTVANPATNTSRIDNVTLQPVSPLVAEAADESAATGQYGTAANIPNGTQTVISYDADGPGGNAPLTATYTWNGTTWTLAAGTPINVGTLQPGQQVSYQATMSFPGTLPADGQVVPVAIIAFPDTGVAGYSGETVNNITLDRIYIGFMQVTKEARILSSTGAVKQDWAASPTVEAAPGDVIEYRISYVNTSPSLTGSGNVGLNALDFKVIEDGDNINDTGAALGTNNWYTNQVGQTPLTVHATGTSVSTGSVRYYDEFTKDANTANDSLIGTVDPATDSVVEAYVNEVGTVVPGGSGQMIIRRKVQ
ncbi:MAG: hypothetical protein WA902_05590 [Thermosynechococcaceae cyanobacterium]